jgi:hypothetical protein
MRIKESIEARLRASFCELTNQTGELARVGVRNRGEHAVDDFHNKLV